MRKFAILFTIGILSLSSCEDTWDKHFENAGQGEGNRSSSNLYEYLQEKPEYSEFFSLIQSTVAGQELAKNQILTCWAVNNEGMPDISALDSVGREKLVKNHINNMALYTPKLSDGKIIKMLSGKNLILQLSDSTGYVLDGVGVRNMNQLCANGVVHELAKAVMPRQNVFEYMMDAGEEYSIFRNYLLEQSDTLFRPDLSFPVGVNETGNTVYDSVFSISNPFFDEADIQNENEDYTLFLPCDDVIREAISEISGFYGRGLTESDTLEFFDWIMKAVFYDEKIENYNTHVALESVFKKDWRTAYQKIAGAPFEASNGLVYKMQKMHVPQNLLVKSYENLLSATYQKLDEQQREEFVTLTNAKDNVNFAYTWNSKKYVQIYYVANAPERSFTWTMTDTDAKGNTVAARVVPGTYKVQMAFRPYYCGKQSVSVNGTEILTEWNLGGYAGQDAKYFDMGEITIPETSGLTEVKVKTSHISGGDARLIIYGIKLIADPSSIY